MSSKSSSLVKWPAATTPTLRLSRIPQPEFFIDFISAPPNIPYANVLSRVIVAPENTKELLETLYENVQRYEATYGPIVRKMAINAPVREAPISTSMFNTNNFQSNEE